MIDPADPNPELARGLMLVHGNHAEALRELMIAWIRRHPLAPLETETILVQSNGIAQWLKRWLARAPDAADDPGCGIAAGLDFSLPSRFLWQVYRAVLGPGAVPEVSPFDKPRLMWRLMRMLPSLVAEPVHAPLARFLADDGDLRKRFQLAERLADLFDQYQVYRADWLAAWAAGRDVLIRAAGAEVPLPPDSRWQAALWRALLADVNDAAGAGRSAVHEAFMAAAADPNAAPVGLPRRVVVFGISSMPRQSLEVLAALARWSQLLVCIHNPCRHHWADIVADQDLLRRGRHRQPRKPGMPEQLDEHSLHLHAQPLLAAWGRQGRDFIALLDEVDNDELRAGYRRRLEAIGQRVDLFESGRRDRLLGQLQDDIIELRPLAESRAEWPSVDPAVDASIRFHVAHGPQREVEILHDQLLAAFDDDSGLQPRDIIVMVPDIDAYAPHVQAVFGLPDADDARHIPFSLADQGRRANDPLLAALALVTSLPESRLGASEVLDLLDVPALRRRFGIDAADLPQLAGWIRGAGVRWGLDAGHRAGLGLPGEGAEAAPNSWLFGLRRMLLGYAAGDGAPAWQGIEPFGEVGGLGAALLGPLVGLVSRLERHRRVLATPAPADEWVGRLRRLLADFFAADDDADALTLVQLEKALAAWQEACAEAGLDEPLPLSVVREHWLACLEARGLGQRFFGGAVTFATLMPMRAIPFRRVCLLGMNDGDYPRSRPPADFDLMGQDYRPGDRSRREDDRYLFLEALLSAREHLHLSWVGRSIHDNSRRPPSVLVGQLRDHLAAGWRLAGAEGESGDALLAALTTEHPLQAFGEAYFRPGPEGLFTYAREWRPPAVAAPSPPAVAMLPPLAPDAPLDLRLLADFLRRPVRAFFRQRLGVFFDEATLAADDVEPFALDHLAQWLARARLIEVATRQALAGGAGVDAALQELAAMARRGELPAGGFEGLAQAALFEPLPDLLARVGAAFARWPEAVPDQPFEFEHAIDGCPLRVEDWVGDLRRNPDGGLGRVVVLASDLVVKGHYRLDHAIPAWVVHLAAQLAAGPVTTELIAKVGECRLPPLAPADAAAHLQALLAAWHDGMRRPLPLAVKTGFAWLAAMPPDADPDFAVDKAVAAARKAYDGNPPHAIGERDGCAALQRAWPDFGELVAGGEFTHWVVALLAPLRAAIGPATETGQ